jgi:hypothetical protein
MEGGASGNFGGEGAGAEHAISEVGVEVEVEVLVGSGAEGGLELVHGGAVSNGSGVVGGERGVDQVEGDADGVVGCVKGGGLVGSDLLRDSAGFGGGGDDMKVVFDGDKLLDLVASESR